MKNDELRNLINESFSEITPDLFEQTLQAVEKSVAEEAAMTGPASMKKQNLTQDIIPIPRTRTAVKGIIAAAVLLFICIPTFISIQSITGPDSAQVTVDSNGNKNLTADRQKESDLAASQNGEPEKDPARDTSANATDISGQNGDKKRENTQENKSDENKEQERVLSKHPNQDKELNQKEDKTDSLQPDSQTSHNDQTGQKNSDSSDDQNSRINSDSSDDQSSQMNSDSSDDQNSRKNQGNHHDQTGPDRKTSHKSRHTGNSYTTASSDSRDGVKPAVRDDHNRSGNSIPAKRVDTDKAALQSVLVDADTTDSIDKTTMVEDQEKPSVTVEACPSDMPDKVKKATSEAQVNNKNFRKHKNSVS